MKILAEKFARGDSRVSTIAPEVLMACKKVLESAGKVKELSSLHSALALLTDLRTTRLGSVMGILIAA